MVSHRGIEANPTKVDAIRRMNRPTRKKDVTKLTGMMAALCRFYQQAWRVRPALLQAPKTSDKFKCTKEADQALEELKTFLTMTSVMVHPAPKETLLLYISASTQVVSTVLVAERPEDGHQYPVQRPVYYVSEVLSDSKVRY
jgi:dsDNA-binding SOS-regulon protein